MSRNLCETAFQNLVDLSKNLSERNDMDDAAQTLRSALDDLSEGMKDAAQTVINVPAVRPVLSARAHVWFEAWKLLCEFSGENAFGNWDPVFATADNCLRAFDQRFPEYQSKG